MYAIKDNWKSAISSSELVRESFFPGLEKQGFIGAKVEIEERENTVEYNMHGNRTADGQKRQIEACAM